MLTKTLKDFKALGDILKNEDCEVKLPEFISLAEQSKSTTEDQIIEKQKLLEVYLRVKKIYNNRNY